MAHSIPAIEEMQYFDALLAVPFNPSRCVDEVLLDKLGILGDVRTLFKNMGLGQLPFMAEPCFQALTSEFLASLTLHINPTPTSTHDIGHIKFCAHDQTHEMSLHTLADIFDLREGGETDLDHTNFNNLVDVWGSISGDEYIPGGNKASSIRHPAIRYAHNYLAHTFYSRADDNTVEEREVLLLAMGIKPLLRRGISGNLIEGDGTNVNMAAILTRNLMQLKEEAIENQLAELNVGSIVTAILKRCGISAPCVLEKPPRFIDEKVLSISRSNVGPSSEKYVYSFQLMPNIDADIFLPNKDITELRKRRNVIFLPFHRLTDRVFPPV